jgi:endonuclease-3
MAAQDIPTVQGNLLYNLCFSILLSTCSCASLTSVHRYPFTGIIQPIGLAPTKAKNLVGMASLLLERHNGQVPSTFEELEALPGVGHKTASVVMAQAFGHPAFPVDTHIHR